ncbi:MAG: pyridoxamine 5'-phosphate oxidase family protein [Desulfobulbaceae bacterium]|nr:pyridoxamine 5'-phosphate oxidase family protein [Desulfobulbaceae bacterium]
MNLSEYFQEKSGFGVLATAAGSGEVDTAVFSAPHVNEDGTIAFIMRDRLTRKNLLSNPFASYLFVESGNHYKGLRLFLKKIKEDDNPELIASMTRRHLSPEEDKAKGPKSMVYFSVGKILPLIGAGDPGVSPL